MNNIIKYISILLSGKAIAAVIGLLSFILVARELSMTEFGLLMLIVSYKQITNRLVNFQTWQALVKFGAEWKNENSHDKFNQLLTFCFRLDAVTAFAAAAIGVISAYVLSNWIDWVAESNHWIAIYCLVLVTNYRGYTTGIFRSFSKFSIQSAILVAASAFKLVGVVALSLIDAAFLGYFLLWMLTDLSINLAEMLASRKILKNNGYKLSLRRATTKLNSDRTLWSFVITSNLDGMMKVLRELDTPIIASVLNIESAAIYTIAKRFSSLITMVADTAFEVVFPETASLIHQKRYRELKLFNFLSASLVGLPSLAITFIFFLAGDNIIALTVGSQYIEGALVTAYCMAGMTIWAFGFPLTAILMSFGNMKLVAFFNIIATLTYIALLLLLIYQSGTLGASISLLLSQIIWLILMLATVINKRIKPKNIV